MNECRRSGKHGGFRPAARSCVGATQARQIWEEMMNTVERPAIVTDEHLEYLDELRESGVTNMYGAGPYLVREFGVTRNESHEILN